jgi:hypothetical protein
MDIKQSLPPFQRRESLPVFVLPAIPIISAQISSIINSSDRRKADLCQFATSVCSETKDERDKHVLTKLLLQLCRKKTGCIECFIIYLTLIIDS